MSLFRAEALRSKHDKRSGTVLHYSQWTRPVGGAALALSVAVLGLVIFGHYTRAVAISGYLVPEGGILRVFAPQPGVVVEKRVKAGDHVVKGDLLYVVSADREGRGEGPLFARATDALRERRAKTADSIEQTRSIQAAELVRLAARRDEVSVRLALLDDKIGILAQSIELRSTILDRKKSLSDRHLTPVDQSDQAALSLLDLRTERASLQVDRSTLLQERAGLENDLKLKPLQQRADLDNLERDLASLDQQLAESETRSENVIAAPASGTLSVDLATLGQAVVPNQPLAVIQPEGAALQVQLFAPSRAVGFVKTDDRVNLRYQAFPYQKFGQYEGRVRSIAHTALSAAELASLNVPQQEQNEPLYRIVVEPSRQAVMVNGGATPLQAGMAVDAFVMQETRAIYEWMLEPLFTVKGVTHAGASDAP
jgi:membrane fusion protein